MHMKDVRTIVNKSGRKLGNILYLMDLKERKLDVSKFEAVSRMFVHIYF